MNENIPTSTASILTSAEVPKTPETIENNAIDHPPTNSEASPESNLESIAPHETPELSIPETLEPSQPTEPKPSYVKSAMRNMVRKRGKSLRHFFLTTLALLGVLVGLAYLTR